MTHAPTCRDCGAPVEYFGDRCAIDALAAAVDADVQREAGDIVAIARADTLALLDRMSREDY